MLQPVNGIKVDGLSFPQLRLVADLIYFDGPLLSYFKDNTGQHYLYYWCDVDDLSNRWLIFRTTPRQLNQFLTQQITLRDLILSIEPGFAFLADVDNQLQPVATSKIRPSQLPEDYLPETETYYDASLTLFHDDKAARDLIVLMQEEAQETKTKLRRIEQAITKNPEAFRELLATP